jgi:hypothetical protein
MLLFLDVVFVSQIGCFYCSFLSHSKLEFVFLVKNFGWDTSLYIQLYGPFTLFQTFGLPRDLLYQLYMKDQPSKYLAILINKLRYIGEQHEGLASRCYDIS